MQLLLCNQLFSGAVMSHGSATDADQIANWTCRFEALPESQEPAQSVRMHLPVCTPCDPSHFAFVTRLIVVMSSGNQSNYAVVLV